MHATMSSYKLLSC